MLLVLGVVGLLWAANKATESADNGAALVGFGVAALVGAVVAGLWCWSTWWRQWQTRTAGARRLVLALGPTVALATAGVVTGALAASWEAAFFGLLGGFLLATMFFFVFAVASGHGTF